MLPEENQNQPQPQSQPPQPQPEPQPSSPQQPTPQPVQPSPQLNPQQPPVGPQPQYPYPPQPPKNNRTKIIVISIVSFVLLAAVAGLIIWLVLSQNKSSDNSNGASNSNANSSAETSGQDQSSANSDTESSTNGNIYKTKTGLATIQLQEGWKVDKEIDESGVNATYFSIPEATRELAVGEVKINPVVTMSSKKMEGDELKRYQEQLSTVNDSFSSFGYKKLEEKKVTVGSLAKYELPSTQEGAKSTYMLTVNGQKNGAGVSFFCTANADDWKTVEAACEKAGESIRFV